MKELLKELCLTDGISGDEGAVRDLIISRIKGVCEYRIDNLGNLICFKKGSKGTLLPPALIKLQGYGVGSHRCIMGQHVVEG